MSKKIIINSLNKDFENIKKIDNYGYLGLYNLTSDEIRKKKGVGKDNILDSAGAVELAANLFRITQTDEKINKENIIGEEHVNATHFEVGRKVRDTIKDIGGTMPEDLPMERHIKELKSEKKKLLKKAKN